jgi:branched-chain amino acid transport system ATP-binding protein
VVATSAPGTVSRAAVDGALETRHLSCFYESTQVIWSVSLRVPSGRGVALVGRNGVGKTTFLRGIAHAFGVRTTGDVRLDGLQVAGWSPEKITRAGVSLVPHDRRILPLSVLDNFQLGARGAPGWRSRVDELLGYFPTLKDRLKQRGDTLSGGEQQAVAIIRALMGRPRYLLLDEPSEGLAPKLVDSLTVALSSLRKDTSVGLLLVDRNVALIEEICDEVHGMSKGRLLRSATAKEFAASEELQVEFLAPIGEAAR